jgi:tight adherence protein C
MFQSQTVESHLPAQIFEGHDDSAKDKIANLQPKPWEPLSTRYKNLDKRIKLPFDLRRKLIKAGSPVGLLEFLAFELLSLILVPVVAFILIGGRVNTINLVFIGAVIGLFLPFWWLLSKIHKRQFKMKKDLPNLIDLLSICVSGGLDFMLAVSRVIRDMKSCDLTRELAEVHRETQMGATRREALKNFAWRIDMPEIYSFVRTLVQADRMGTSIGDALKLQSEEIRVRRFQRGEAMALKAPIKLLFPLFVFIMPTVLIIVAAPILLTFLKGNINMGF